jgi:hypothetical protein
MYSFNAYVLIHCNELRCLRWLKKYIDKLLFAKYPLNANVLKFLSDLRCLRWLKIKTMKEQINVRFAFLKFLCIKELKLP